MSNSVVAIVEYDYTAKEPDEIDLLKGAIINNINIQPGGWWEGTIASNGKTGMFPDNFVRLIDTSDDKSSVILRDKSSTVHRKCRVIYSYTQINEDELSLTVGDIIELLGEVEEGWWRGKLNDKVGVFPSNFVVEKEPSPVLANRRSVAPAVTTVAPPNYSQISITNNKINNRNSFHNSKEDLLNTSSTNSINSITSNSNYDKDAPLLPPKPVREYCKVLYAYDPQNEDELELKMGDIITILTKELPDKGWWRGEVRGKVGVFPDNFVTLLPPEVSPSKDNSTHQTTNQIYPNLVYIKKSGSNASAHGNTSNINSNSRKDSFGSRDSLNDILNETGIPAGNVAAQRKSLENKNFDLSGPSASIAAQVAAAAGDAARLARKSIETQKQSETRKSMENIKEEKKTPPPVLTKKPTIPAPSKKPTSVTSVAGNLLSGLTKKVSKSVEQKLTSSVSQDSADGLVSSKQSRDHIASDGGDKSVIMERMRSVDAVEFDTVERSSMLPDMRAGRVKAPKRRPPSAAINVIGESNNNNSVYLNGAAEQIESNKAESSPPSNHVDDGELAKPKPRGWETQKAPWMAELKANVEKKKVVGDPKPMDRTKLSVSSESNDRNSLEKKDRNSFSENNSNVTNNNNINNSCYGKSEASMSKPINVQRKSIETPSAPPMPQTTSTAIIATSSITSTTDMTKSMTGIKPDQLDDIKLRPNSLSIRNRSISPTNRNSATKPADVQNVRVNQSITTNQGGKTTTTINSSNQQISQQQTSVLHENVCQRVLELEQKVAKLEMTVQTQSKIIEELIKSLREEADNVKGLKTELDKYAQCVTQV